MIEIIRVEARLRLYQVLFRSLSLYQPKTENHFLCCFPLSPQENASLICVRTRRLAVTIFLQQSYGHHASPMLQYLNCSALSHGKRRRQTFLTCRHLINSACKLSQLRATYSRLPPIPVMDVQYIRIYVAVIASIQLYQLFVYECSTNSMKPQVTP